MVGCALILFICMLELMCISVGGGLMEANAGAATYRLWLQAVCSIPLTGFVAAAANLARLRRRALCWLCVGVGAVVSAYWLWHAAISKRHDSWLVEGLVSSMALMAAMLLAGAGAAGLGAARSEHAGPDATKSH